MLHGRTGACTHTHTQSWQLVALLGVIKIFVAWQLSKQLVTRIAGSGQEQVTGARLQGTTDKTFLSLWLLLYMLQYINVSSVLVTAEMGSKAVKELLM